jgi:lipid-binding SYLF domain-containing protein
MEAHPRSAGALALEAVLFSATLSLGACSSGQPQSAADVEKKQSEEAVRLDQSTQLIGEFRSKIPDNVASRARCLVVVPGMKQGGLLIGGMGGKGFATCASGGAWSSPAPISMGGGTIGAQIGYQSADVLALVVSDQAAKALEAGNFKIGASASAAAGPTGAGASSTGDVGVKSDIVSYTSSSGLFAGATLNGMTVSSDDNGTRALYGTDADLASILERRANLPQPAPVARFTSALTNAFAPSAISIGGEQRTASPTAESR